MAEQPTLVEPIWNSPRYCPFWAVVDSRDSHRATATASSQWEPEHAADRRLQRQRREARASRTRNSSGAPRSYSPAGDAPFRVRELRADRDLGDRSKTRSKRCVLKNRIVPRYLGSRRACARAAGRGSAPAVATLALRGVGVERACIVPQRPASRERTQAGQRVGLSNGYLLSGDRDAARTGAARVSRSGHGTRRATNRDPESLQRAKKACHERNRAVTTSREAAGQGFEPQLPGPEPGGLPLDDPATAGRSVPGRLRASSAGPISSRYTGTRRFSASVSMRATTSTYGSRPDPRSFALSSPSTW